MTYGAMIRNAREARNWTQQELAERLGTSKTTISNWEREETMPGIADINAVCTALSLSPESLLKAFGVTLTPPAASRLPRVLVEALLELSPEQLVGLTALAIPAAEQNRRARRPAP